MARIEKTIFISYRRKDISWALAVYQYLTSQKYDVFFDFSSLSSGDFEQIIVSNIRARAHFILVLTPTALDRCSQPGDWLRREIETAVDEKRNIIPLLFDGFNFGSPAIIEKLTGKLDAIPRYNALDIPSGYFMEAMERLRRRYLNIPLEAVTHPVSTQVRKVVQEEQIAADKALEQNKDDIDELIKPAEEKPVGPKQPQITKSTPLPFGSRGAGKTPNLRTYGIGAGILLIATLGIFGISSLFRNFGKETAIPTLTSQLVSTSTLTSVLATQPLLVPANTETPILPTSVPTLGIDSTLVSAQDGMTLVYVPAGEFTMGSNDGVSDEGPVHQVFLDAFWIDQTEVTNAMYIKCADAGVCQEPTNKVSAKNINYYRNTPFNNYPVIYVDWTMAKTYCSWAGRRLPGEAEWEKAARGDEGRTYPWGDDSPNSNLLNYNNIVADTSSVKSYESGKSIYGAYDMSGNVWEWVSSLYLPYPYDINDGREDLSAGGDRVHRGGSFYDNDSFVYSAKRDKGDPGFVSFNLGFRCALDVSP